MVAQLLFRVATDIAFALQHIEHTGTQLRSWRRDAVLAGTLAVADAGEQIAQGISE